jgi:hypothetical protein
VFLYLDFYLPGRFLFQSILVGFYTGRRQWKPLLVREKQIEADLVKTIQRLKRVAVWNQIVWRTALASHMQVTLPEGLNEAVKLAQQNYHRCGRRPTTPFSSPPAIRSWLFKPFSSERPLL